MEGAATFRTCTPGAMPRRARLRQTRMCTSRVGNIVQVEEGVSTPARNPKGRDEDVHEADKIQEVGGAVLPESALPVDDTLLPVLPLFLDEEGMVLLGLPVHKKRID